MRVRHVLAMALTVLVFIVASMGQDAWSQSQGGPGIDVPGLRFHVKPEDLPLPHATPSVGNGATRTVKPSENLSRSPRDSG